MYNYPFVGIVIFAENRSVLIAKREGVYTYTSQWVLQLISAQAPCPPSSFCRGCRRRWRVTRCLLRRHSMSSSSARNRAYVSCPLTAISLVPCATLLSPCMTHLEQQIREEQDRAYEESKRADEEKVCLACIRVMPYPHNFQQRKLREAKEHDAQAKLEEERRIREAEQLEQVIREYSVTSALLMSFPCSNCRHSVLRRRPHCRQSQPRCNQRIVFRMRLLMCCGRTSPACALSYSMPVDGSSAASVRLTSSR